MGNTVIVAVLSLFVQKCVAQLPKMKLETGIVVCAGGGDLFIETITFLEHTRFRTNSTLPICIAHCDEISPSMQKFLTTIPGVFVLDICGNDLRGSFDSSGRQRLRGFFCKPAALMASPFRQTILVDSDVIWFKKPELLLESPSFLSSGALFFRDRWTQTKNRLTLTKGSHKADSLAAYLSSLSKIAPSLLTTNRRQLQHQHKHLRTVARGNRGIMSGTPLDMDLLTANNSYWRHFVTGQGLTLDHMQDSSVVVFDSSSHPLTAALLKYMLPQFNAGYGDKEMYWLAATASGEAFNFEPHVAGSLGDCGALVHFDPRAPRGGTQAVPFYVNAEYLIDLQKLKAVGDFIDTDPSDVPASSDGAVTPVSAGPARITTPVLMDEQSTQLFALSPWKNMKHGFYPCGACSHFACEPAAAVVLSEIRARQKMILDVRDAFKSDPAKATIDDYNAARKAFEDLLHPAQLGD